VNNRIVLILASLAFVALCWWSVARHTGSGSVRTASARFAGAAATPVQSAAPEPSLHVTQRDGRVFLEGTLPDQATREAVLVRARSLYGASRIQDSLQVRAGLASVGWSANAGEILPAFGTDAPAASLIADGETISLRGQVPSEEVKTKLVADANAAAGENVTVIDDLSLSATASASAAPAASTAAPLAAPASSPAPAATPEPQGIAGTIARAVGTKCNQFDSGSAELTRDCERALDVVARALLANPSARLIVEGHTDNIGAREVNRRISERRAKAVKSYLLAKGVNSHHAIAIGYGESRPIADNASPDGRKRNRRIEFVVK
jgi:OOP family OmpA-OmpF porin